MKHYEEIQTKLKNALKESRFEHTIGVMYTAAGMAMAHGYDIDKAMLAGLLHDCAKCLSYEEQVQICEDNNREISEFERGNRALLHSKAGAILAKIEYNITDEEILHAIEYHTTSIANMNILDKIIYIADYIEPTRDQAPNLKLIRQLAYSDLDACLAQILYDTLEYLNAKGYVIDPITAESYEFYKGYRKEF